VWRFYKSPDNKEYWEIEWKGDAIFTSGGPVGRTAKVYTRSYEDVGKAKRAAAGMIKGRLAQGYSSAVSPPISSPSMRMGPAPAAAPATTANGAAPAAPRAGRQGTPKQDAYKVYPWKQKRRVVRVGGKLFGTETDGGLKGGGATRFNANDRVRVSHDGDNMKVSDTATDYSQTWDPIDEVRAAIGAIVSEMVN
jgi:hypothetical protein